MQSMYMRTSTTCSLRAIYVWKLFQSYFESCMSFSTHHHKQNIFQWTTSIFLSSPYFRCTATVISNFCIFLTLMAFTQFLLSTHLVNRKLLHLGCKYAEIGTFHCMDVQCLAQSSIWGHRSSALVLFQSIWNWQQNLTLLVFVSLAWSICFSICLSTV